jgi:hypothetical protein
MGLQDYFQGDTNAAQADFMRRKRLERQQREAEAAALAEAEAEAERQANAEALRQATLQYQQQQQAVQQGYEQDAAKSLDQFGLLRLIGDYNIGRDAFSQGLSQGMSALSGDTGRVEAALAPTKLPRRGWAQGQQPSVIGDAVGNAVMKPLSLYESIIAQAEGTKEQISTKTQEAKERAKALLRVIRNAR